MKPVAAKLKPYRCLVQDTPAPGRDDTFIARFRFVRDIMALNPIAALGIAKSQGVDAPVIEGD